MANISDVYDINFEASTDELAEVLEQYIKIADQDAYYNLAGDLSRYGKIIAGGDAEMVIISKKDLANLMGAK
jgi:glutamate-1-semialdehyde aminotransferase